jgi:hypothetical protein
MKKLKKLFREAPVLLTLAFLLGLGLVTAAIYSYNRGRGADHYSRGKVVQVTHNGVVGEDQTTYELRFVPNMNTTDTLSVQISKLQYDLVNVGDDIDYQKIR